MENITIKLFKTEKAKSVLNCSTHQKKKSEWRLHLLYFSNKSCWTASGMGGAVLLSDAGVLEKILRCSGMIYLW